MRSALLLSVLLTGCVAYQSTPVGVYDGNPCNQSYFDAVACQAAVQMGGWYVGGVLYRLSGGYDYNYYVRQEHIYIQHGGRVTPYRDAVKSVNAGGKTYVPPSQRAVSQGGGSYTPPSGGKPATTYTPPSKPATTPYTPPSRPASSYSPPSRPASSYSPPSRSRK